MIKAIPMELKDVQNYINENHRHHQASHRDKFRVAAEINGKIVGVAQVGRPTGFRLDDGKTLEVTRLCTDGTKDVCSFLYSRCARIAKELGYTKIITFILDSETGTSLKASGWFCEDDNCGGDGWDKSKRGQERAKYEQLELFEKKQKYPIGVKKQRWVKEL